MFLMKIAMNQLQNKSTAILNSQLRGNAG